MKKFLVLVMALVMVFSFTSVAFAAHRQKEVKAFTIDKCDVANKVATVSCTFTNKSEVATSCNGFLKSFEASQAKWDKALKIEASDEMYVQIEKGKSIVVKFTVELRDEENAFTVVFTPKEGDAVSKTFTFDVVVTGNVVTTTEATTAESTTEKKVESTTESTTAKEVESTTESTTEKKVEPTVIVTEPAVEDPEIPDTGSSTVIGIIAALSTASAAAYVCSKKKN